MAFEYEIVKTLGVITEKHDRVLEVNIVSWNRHDPKIDIRWWDKDHDKMYKGVAMSDEEAQTLLKVLKERYE